MPALTDPTFAGTVVYVLDHSDSGTLGVVLGRPSQVEIRDVLPGWCDLAVDPGVFHVGGPCETDTALCLATAAATAAAGDESGCAGWPATCYLVDLDADPDELAGELTGLRVFAGYAGLVARPARRRDRRGRLGLRAGPARDVLSEAAGPSCGARCMGRQTGPARPCCRPHRRTRPRTEPVAPRRAARIW